MSEWDTQECHLQITNDEPTYRAVIGLVSDYKGNTLPNMLSNVIPLLVLTSNINWLGVDWDEIAEITLEMVGIES